MKKSPTDTMAQQIEEMTQAREQARAAHQLAFDQVKAEYERKLDGLRDEARKFQARALDGAQVLQLQATVERQTGIINLLNEQVATRDARITELERHALDEAREALADRILGRIVAFMGEG